MRQVATPGTAGVREFVYSDARHHPMLRAPLPRSYRDVRPGGEPAEYLHIQSRPQHLVEASYAYRTANGAFWALGCITSR
jgi:hypothetical protein